MSETVTATSSENPQVTKKGGTSLLKNLKCILSTCLFVLLVISIGTIFLLQIELKEKIIISQRTIVALENQIAKQNEGINALGSHSFENTIALTRLTTEVEANNLERYKKLLSKEYVNLSEPEIEALALSRLKNKNTEELEWDGALKDQLNTLIQAQPISESKAVLWEELKGSIKAAFRNLEKRVSPSKVETTQNPESTTEEEPQEGIAPILIQ